jgi:alcohol dehydrogenase class IV
VLGVHEAFTWRDGERLIRFKRGALAEAVEVLEGPGYALLTTERAAAAAPAVVEAAAVVHHVPGGLVDEIAAGLLGEIGDADRIVALGGGRVIDTAKALAAARGGRAMAIPTTLSGAEMTRIHRLPAGVRAPLVRPAVVVNDPALSASQPPEELAASALNALGHVAEAPCTRMANPVATLAALYGGRLLAGAWASGQPDRDALARGALLAGYAIDSAAYGLHHVLSQTLVRVGGIGHGPANAIMLPHTLGALAWRFPHQHQSLCDAVGGDPAEVAARLCALTGATTLGALGLTHDDIVACADAAAERAELDLTPPRADRAELVALYDAAL